MIDNVDGGYFLPWYIDLGIMFLLLPVLMIIGHVAGKFFFDDYDHSWSDGAIMRNTVMIAGSISAIIWWPLTVTGLVGLGTTAVAKGLWETFDDLERKKVERKQRKADAEAEEQRMRKRIQRELEAAYESPIDQINRALKEKR